MRKTYAAPTVTSLDVVRETKGAGGISEAPNGPVEAPGSVGFNL